MEVEKDVINENNKNEGGGVVSKNTHISASCCCQGKWQVIVLAIILIVTILQMSELIKISEALKSIDVNMR